MDKKLFVIGIGGTGARVIRSCVMLLAAGIKLEGYTEVVFILIDPDKSNGDLLRTIDILKKYQSIRKKLKNFQRNSFFATKVTTLNELEAKKDNPNQVVDPEFKFQLMGVDDQRFQDFIEYGDLGYRNQAMIQAFFSKANLDSDMQVGFKGNPNIGSVVLNQFKDSKEFQTFASNFGKEDRIFLINSIFGGTGAAGFPLLLKNIRNAEKEQKLQNAAYLTNAAIGGLTILPYFGVEPDENSQIDKATFMSKTKAALSYYMDNIVKNKSINALYTIGDHVAKDYANHEGSMSQKNDAHFVEFAGALAVFDFAGLDGDYLLCDKGRAVQNVFMKEFAIKENTDPITLKSLSNLTNAKVAIPMAQFRFFVKYLQEQISQTIDQQPWSTNGEVKIDKSFITNSLFYTDFLMGFIKHYSFWLDELGENKQAFAPFRDVDANNLFQMVNGYESKGSGFLEKKNYAFYDNELNKLSGGRDLPSDLPLEDKFMSLFSLATASIVKSKYNFS